MLLTPTISRLPESDPALDHQKIYALGLDHVRRLSRRIWTDHNAHDPGITILELLCYAISDLSYRAQFSVADLLATPRDNAENMARQFYTPRQILTCRPLTELDYRKLIIDRVGVKNAWIYPVATPLFADTIKGKLHRENPGTPGIKEVAVRGNFGVRLQYMDDVRTAEGRELVNKDVEKVLAANRNLCEDFVEISQVSEQPLSLCAEIELESDSDAVEVAAQIRLQIGQYLAPLVRSYSLEQMLAHRHADQTHYTIADIFAGPALDHGFIADAELASAQLRESVYLSDLINIIMDIAGVRAVREIVINLVYWDEVTSTYRAIKAENPWHLAIPKGALPCWPKEAGHLVFYKRNVPVLADVSLVHARIEELSEEERISVETFGLQDLPLPLGRARDVAQYHSFQNHFPEFYGLSSVGLSAQSGSERLAQVLQLKGYLLFFDQLMANYFAQLAEVRSLFHLRFAEDYHDAHSNARTRFAQRVESFKGFSQVYASGVDTAALSEAIENESQAIDRRNKILDHLLARFAEDFHHYAQIIRSAFGASPTSVALSKARFLGSYPSLGAERTLAWNKSLTAPEELWNSKNVSGLERRIASLLGIADFSRRNLASVAYEAYAELDETPGDEFRFRIRHAINGKILLSSSTHYATPELAKAEMQQAIIRAQMLDGYSRKVTVDGKHYFNIVDESDEVIARRIEYFATAQAMETAIDDLIGHLREFYSGEGLYLIENLLLLPAEKAPPYSDPLLPICTDPTCTDCAQNDPYSYRVHVILPAYAGRFQNVEFRAFVEETIRQEMPAHILPKICWVNEDDMAMVESAYRAWIPLRAGVSDALGTANRRAKISALIDALYRIKNIYPTRLLHECSSDASKPPFVLGRSALGSEDLKS
jgi:hypothetical protein